MSTYMANAQTVQQKWIVIDATDLVVGRLAVTISNILRGKHRPQYTPHHDTGEFVIVINAEKVKFTGKKWEQKTYAAYSHYPGGLRVQTAQEVLDKHPERILITAVRRMVPRIPMFVEGFTKQVRYYYANGVAVHAAKTGVPLPDGSMMFAEVYSARLDADKKPVMGSDGFFVADKLIFYTAMGRDAGWGADIPDMLKNENWNYAVFTLDKQVRPGVNQAECLACHKPHDNTSYLFTLKELTEVAKAK